MLDPQLAFALVQRAREGDAKAIRALVEHHYRPAYSVALSIVHHPQDAEDIAQDALIKAFDNIDMCRDPYKFTAWLLQIARNCARNRVAGRRQDGTDVDGIDEASPWPADAGSDSRDRLLVGLHLLTERQREIVLLHDLECWTHPEIALSLGISETLSRQHLFVARRKLRQFLEPTDQSPDATERVAYVRSTH